ncbi:MAG: hypothetical protein JWM59_4576 [Verrucomicrobiales bacterium]|nr:hypothetical protein [Verrucomicrobiales bacterium]
MVSHLFRNTITMLAGAVACTAFGYYLGGGTHEFNRTASGPASTALRHGAGAFQSPPPDPFPPLPPGSPLVKILQQAGKLDRIRSFAAWLAGVDAQNWKARWESFAQFIQGREDDYEGELRLFLQCLAEVDAAGASADFAALEAEAEHPLKTAVVLSTWAARNPQRAADFMCGLLTMKNAEELVPGMILGTARHGADSLIRLSLDPRFRAYDFPTSKPQELIQALKRHGQPEDGEKLWRAHQAVSDQQQGGGVSYISHPKLFNALLRWKTDAADTAESAAGVCRWLSGVIDGGYVDNSWSNAGLAAGHYAKLDPAAAFEWVREYSVKAGARTDQIASMANQIGYGPALEWAKKDPAALSQWLTANSGKPGFEAGAAALYTELRQSDPEASAAWGEVVKFDWLRRAAGLPP